MSLRIIYIKLSQASVLLPVWMGFRYYRRLTPPFRLLLFFFLISIGFEIQASVLGKLFHNNMPGLRLFTIVEFLAFSAVYYLFFRKQHWLLRALIGVNALVFVAVAARDLLSVHNIQTVNTLSRSYSSVSMLCYALIYFYFMFGKDDERYSSAQPMFWINTGVLVYFGANELYFMFNKYLLVRSPATETIGLYIHDAVNIIANCLFAQSFRCFRQKAIS